MVGVCSQCDKPESKCDCEKYCSFCQSQISPTSGCASTGCTIVPIAARPAKCRSRKQSEADDH